MPLAPPHIHPPPSSPADLFQNVAFEFYGHIIANLFSKKHSRESNARPYIPRNGDEYSPYMAAWFSRQHPGSQLFAGMCLVAWSWLVQRYFQDELVARLYTRFLMRAAAAPPATAAKREVVA